jgi:hypothetical protein
MFTLALDDQALPHTVLFAPRAGASFAARPLRFARFTRRADHRVVITRSESWPASTRVLTLDRDIPVSVADDRLAFTVSAEGSFSVYVGDACVLHLFAEPPHLTTAPAGALDATAHGVIPDSPALQTTALQALLDLAARQPGVTVYFPAGIYRTGALFASGSTRLHLHPDAVLQGSDDPADYLTHAQARAGGRLPVPGTVAYGALLTFSGGAGGGVVGGGTLDGAGHRLRERLADASLRSIQFNLVAAFGCDDLTFADVWLRDSEFWNTHLYRCSRVRIHRVKVLNEIPHRGWNPHVRDIFWNNADGINSDTCRDVLIEDCFIHTGDDCLTLKLTDPQGDDSAVLEDIVMRRCVLCSSTSGMKVGTETRGLHVARARFEHMRVLPDHTGSVATISIFDVARVRDVLYRDIRCDADCRFIDVTVRARRPAQTRFGSLDGLRFERVRLRSAGPCILRGHSAEHAIDNVSFTDVQIAGHPLRSLAELGLTDTPFVASPHFTDGITQPA